MPFNEEAFNELKEKLLASVNGHAKEKPKRLAMGLYALAYANHGYPVFPLHEKEPDGECSCGRFSCKSLGKHPRHAGWQSQATVDAGLIRSMWGEYPTANVGVACGEAANLTVLDVDGDAGRASLRELELEHGELPETRMVITGRGGNHYYFDYEPGVIGRTHIAEGLDLRTEGNLVVGVGSRTTGEYVWAVGYSPQDLPQAQMPQWLKKLGQKTVREVTTTDQNQRPQVPIEQAAQMLRYINAEKRRDIWFDVCKACKSEWGRHGRKLWDDWARQYAPFDEDDQNKTWASINVDGGTTIGTLIKLAKDGGWVPATTNGNFPSTIPARDLIVIENAEQAEISNDEYLNRPAIVERLCYAKAISLTVGGKHEGKTTNIRTRALAISAGEPWMGRNTIQTPVIYAASADEYATTRMELLRMGWRQRDLPLTLVKIGDDEAEPQAIAEKIAELAVRLGARYVVLDMLFDFLRVQDENKYAQTRSAIGIIQTLGDDIDGHVDASHHTPKWFPDAAGVAKAALGSQGIAARFSPIILCRKWYDDLYTIESTMTRDPRGLAIKPTLVLRGEDGWARDGGEFKQWMKWKAYVDRILELFDGDDDKVMSVNAVHEALDVSKHEVANALLQMHRNQMLDRRRGRGNSYLYSKPRPALFEPDRRQFD